MSLFLLIVGAPVTASAQLAGAPPTATLPVLAPAPTPPPPPPPPPVRRAPRRASPVSSSSVTNESPSNASAESSLQLASIAPLSSSAPDASSSHQTVNNTTLTVHSGEGRSPLACVPDCRSGYVCREGECVSACNPGCGENEVCNAKRECVARTESNEPYPYDHVRFGAGAAGGVATSSDGVGTPLGGFVGVAIPLKGHLYSREDVIATYSQTETDDHPYIGGAVAPGVVPVKQTYLLVALRATAGYQFASSFSARAGVLAGSHTLHTEHASCGAGFLSADNTSFAVGGTGGLAFTGKHVELAAIADVYSAETQALCAISPAGAYFAQPAVLVPNRDIAGQILGQISFLF